MIGSRRFERLALHHGLLPNPRGLATHALYLNLKPKQRDEALFALLERGCCLAPRGSGWWLWAPASLRWPIDGGPCWHVHHCQRRRLETAESVDGSHVQLGHQRQLQRLDGWRPPNFSAQSGPWYRLAPHPRMVAPVTRVTVLGAQPRLAEIELGPTELGPTELQPYCVQDQLPERVAARRHPHQGDRAYSWFTRLRDFFRDLAAHKPMEGDGEGD